MQVTTVCGVFLKTEDSTMRTKRGFLGLLQYLFATMLIIGGFWVVGNPAIQHTVSTIVSTAMAHERTATATFDDAVSVITSGTLTQEQRDVLHGLLDQADTEAPQQEQSVIRRASPAQQALEAVLPAARARIEAVRERLRTTEVVVKESGVQEPETATMEVPATPTVTAADDEQKPDEPTTEREVYAGTHLFKRVNKDTYLEFIEVELEPGDGLLKQMYFSQFTDFERGLYPTLQQRAMSDEVIYLNIIAALPENAEVLEHVLSQVKNGTLPMSAWEKTKQSKIFIPTGHVSALEVAEFQEEYQRLQVDTVAST